MGLGGHLQSTVQHATFNPAAVWLCMSKRPFFQETDKMQKDQSRCTWKITSPESVTTYWGERKKKKWHIPQKPGLKQERYSYLVKLMYGDNKYKKNQYNFLWHLHFLWPACDTIQIEAVMIRFGQGFYYKEGWGGGWKTRMIEDPQIARLRLSAVP